MQPGRKPKPPVLHVVDGSARHLGAEARKRLQAAPVDLAPVGAAPASFTSEQRAVWVRLTEEAPAGLLAAVDHDLLINYVVAIAARDKALAQFNATGCQVLVRSGDGRGTITNPLMRELRRLAESMRMMQGELGFTPSARSRVQAPSDGEGDELQPFLGPTANRR
jgi:P27 family predicted phage terminase small subunit